MNKVVKELLEKPMDRKDFLKHVGVGALFVAGGGMIFNAIKLQQQADSKQLASNKSLGYGSSVYGGNKAQV